MLISLYAKNFILIQQLRVSFAAGLNVITGESGAGKTVLLKAIETCLGAPFYRTYQLDKNLDTVVSLVLQPTERLRQLKELLSASAIQGREIIVRRVLPTGGGAARSFINDMPVSTSLLKELQPLVFETYRQDQKQLLFSSEYQLGLVDAFLGTEKDLNAFAARYDAYQQITQQLQRLLASEQERERNKDRLAFEIDEIEHTAPRTGEYAELINQRRIARNQLLIASLSRKLSDTLYEAEDSIHSRLAQAIDDLSQLARFFPELESVPARLNDGLYTIADAVEQIQLRQADDQVLDLDVIERRMKELESLFRKYGQDENEIFSYLTAIKAELHMLENSEQTGKELQEKQQQTAAKLKELADVLHGKRRKAAATIGKQVEQELHNMAMQHARFTVALRHQSDVVHYTRSGADAVDFLYAPHYNISPLPLHKTASGGELSRVALAVKSVFRRHGNTPVSLFDEVDSGIGGETAHTVARLLKDMAAEGQTIVITHLHQIARQADHHICIQKVEHQGLPEITARILADREREAELVRMLGGRESLDDIEGMDYC